MSQKVKIKFKYVPKDVNVDDALQNFDVPKNSSTTAKGPPPPPQEGGVLAEKRKSVDAGLDATVVKVSETNKKPTLCSRPTTTTTSAPPPPPKEGSDDGGGVVVSEKVVKPFLPAEINLETLEEDLDVVKGVLMSTIRNVKEIESSNVRYVKKLESSNESLRGDKQKLETRVRELELINKKLEEDLRQAASDLCLTKANIKKQLHLVSKSLDDLSTSITMSSFLFDE